MTKRIGILGSTGSVGTSTLKLIGSLTESMEVVLLAARSSRDQLLEQARRFRPRILAIGGAEDATWLRSQLADEQVEVVHGETGLIQAIERANLDLTVSAIVGAAGLKPTMAAIRSGSDIALANKESMVVAGRFMNEAAKQHEVTILPVDSEHNALHQCLRGEKRDEVKRLILTASGGPFRTREGSFEDITPQEALKHPTWDMGPKITIDSATMMNKGLEVIEAHYLFGFPLDRIDIVVHPQSIVHSMIETIDGSYLCQLGETDMVHPIQYALTYPRRLPSPFEGFDITRGAQLEFFQVDKKRFPCIQLAYDALQMGGAAPAVLNAANEIAVERFLAGQLKFTEIPVLNRRTMEQLGELKPASLEDLLDIDRRARETAAELASGKLSN